MFVKILSITDLIKKIKLKLMKELNTKCSEFTASEELEKLICSRHNLIMADSIQKYVNKAPVTRKAKFLHHIFFFMNLVVTIKWLVLSIFNQDIILISCGEFLYVLLEIKMLSRAIFIASSCFLMGDTLQYYLESKHQLFYLDLIWNIKTQSYSYLLPTKYWNKLSKNSFIMGKVFNMLLDKILTPWLAIIFPLISVKAYFDESIKHNLAILSLNCLATILWVRHCLINSMGACFVSFMTIKFLEYKFKQLIDMINGNTLLIPRVIVDFDTTCRIIKQLSILFNIALSLVYMFFPFFFVFIIQIIIDETTTNSGRLLLLFFMIIAVIVNYYVFDVMSSISTANKSIVKHLYPIIVDRNFRKLRLRLRIDSFIARLNEEFVGFICLRYVDLKRSTFLIYIISITRAYFLVSSLVFQSVFKK